MSSGIDNLIVMGALQRSYGLCIAFDSELEKVVKTPMVENHTEILIIIDGIRYEMTLAEFKERIKTRHE